MSALLVFCAFLIFAKGRLLTYLHMLQQDDYHPRRFLDWLGRTRAFDTRVTAALLLLNMVAYYIPMQRRIAGLVMILIFATAALAERDPRFLSKKKLGFTARAQRIYSVSMLLCAAAAAFCAHATLWPVAWVLPVQAVPLLLVLGNWLLKPVEAHIQQSFLDEAKDRLAKLKPTIIGITGSYGKTSVKHILGHILEISAPTLVTPGSTNTTMGISRIIRERLQPHHRFFIAEMGAYGPGSIRRLCDLTPPDLAIITAIGKAHYERFKSLDTVARAKFELAEAVAAKHPDGKLVTTTEALIFPAAQSFANAHPGQIISVGETPDAGLFIQSITQNPQGTSALVLWQGKPYRLQAPLHGEHHGANMALAFAAACTLGMAPDDALVALKSTPQITHRFEVKPQPGGAILIDDAFNSNPVGFAAALKTMSVLRRKEGRTILITPGMVELGAAHDEEHEHIGRLAAAHIDILLPVRPERIESLITAYETAAPNGQIIRVNSFTDAHQWLTQNQQPNDVILLENDLPDLYEYKLRL